MIGIRAADDPHSAPRFAASPSRRRFAALGYEPIVESPEDFAAAIRVELDTARAMTAGGAAAKT